MGSFFKRILAKKSEQPAVEVHVAAFGKHPGWDDHVEDLGIETNRLVAVKRILYTQGIAGNIDSGAWEKLSEAERLERFQHLFIWHSPRDIVVGRLWSSSDGKGRTRYPMVVCCQCTGLSLQWVFQEVFPRLERVETRCVATSSADDVRAIIAETTQSLRQRAQGEEPVREAVAGSPRALAQLAERPEMAPGHQGMHRILYLIEREMAAYHAEGPDSAMSSTAMVRASHLRVPACGETPRAATTLWLGYLLERLDPGASMLIIVPLGRPWLDIVVGEPGVQQFFPVRASLAALPLATEIPYNLDPEFIAQAEAAIDESRGGPAPPPGAEPIPESPQAEVAASTEPATPGAEATTPPEPAPPEPQPAPPEPQPTPPEVPKPEPAPPPPEPEPTPLPKPVPEKASVPEPLEPKPPAPTPEPPVARAEAKPEPRPEPIPDRAVEPFVAPRAEPAAARGEWAPAGGPERSLRWLWMALLAVVAAAVMALLFVPMLTAEKKEVVEEQPFTWTPEDAGAWKALCEAYHNWFGGFREAAKEERLAEWSKDNALAELVVKRIEEVRRVNFDPRVIVGEVGGSLTDMKLNPPKRAMTHESVAKTKQTLELIRNIQEGILQWPSHGEASLNPLAKAYAGRGWTKQAAIIEAAADRLKPSGSGAALVQAIDDALAIKRTLAPIEACVKAIRGHEEALKTFSSGVAERADERFLAETRAADDLASLLARAKAIEGQLAAAAASSKAADACVKAIRDAGDEALAQRFRECVAESAAEADLAAVTKLAADAATAARSAEEHLKDIKAQRDAIAATGDTALADKLWELVLAAALAAPKQVSALSASLGQASAPAAKAATLRKEIQKQRDAMKGLGESVLARHAKAIQVVAGNGRTLDALLEGIDAVKALGEKIVTRWGEVQALQAVVVGAGDKVLAQFGAYALGKLGADEDIATLPDRLDAVEAVAKALADVVQGDWKNGKIDQKLFAAESSVHRGFDGNATEKVLQAWAREVGDYVRLDPKDDPRPAREGWTKALEDLGWRIAFLRESADAQKKTLGDDCAKIHEQLGAGLKRTAELAWVKKNQAAVTQAAAGLTKSLAALTGQLKDVIEPPEKWLKDVRAPGALTSSSALNAEWAKRRDALVPQDLTPQGLLADPKRYSALWRGSRTLRDFLKGLDDEKQLPKGLPQAAKQGTADVAQKAVAEQIAAKREHALAAALAAIPWGADSLPAVPLAELQQKDGWRKAVGDYVQWRDRAAGLLAAAGEMAKQIDAGYLPNDKPDDAPRSVQQLLRAWEKETVPQELLPILAPTVARAGKLAALGALDRKGLVERAGAIAKDDPPQVCMILWRKLGEAKDWPGNAAELDLELKLRAAVAEAADTVRKADPRPVAWVADELATEGSRRWETAFNALAAAASAMSLADPDVAKAVKLASELQVVAEKLAPLTRFRGELYNFRQTLAGLPDEEPKKSVNATVEAFAKAVAALPGGAAVEPSAAALLKELQDFVKQEVPDDPSVGLDKGGPAGGQMAGKWTAEISDGGRAVAYTWAEKGHRLAFERVEPRDKASKPCYLCTAETSVGLFTDVIRALDRPREASVLLDYYRQVEAPKCPRVWEWRRRADQVPEASKALTWLEREARSGQHYADGVAPKRPPADDDPMQYISAPAALYLSWLLGCRLPTVAEWQAASEAARKSAPAQPPNLRDLSWRKQQEHIAKKAQLGIRPEWPDDGIFWPDGVNDRKEGRDAAVVTDQDDGVLWFSPVGSGKGFKHLVGNVAEFLYDAPEDFEATVQALGKTADCGEVTAAFIKLVQDHAASLRVIGGSALSAPQVWDGKGRPFDKAWPMKLNEKKGGRDSFADVGFRLAFTAARETPSSQLRRLVLRWGYLAKAPK